VALKYHQSIKLLWQFISTIDKGTSIMKLPQPKQLSVIYPFFLRKYKLKFYNTKLFHTCNDIKVNKNKLHLHVNKGDKIMDGVTSTQYDVTKKPITSVVKVTTYIINIIPACPLDSVGY
jgi:hypothetical protein